MEKAKLKQSVVRMGRMGGPENINNPIALRKPVYIGFRGVGIGVLLTIAIDIFGPAVGRAPRPDRRSGKMEGQKWTIEGGAFFRRDGQPLTAADGLQAGWALGQMAGSCNAGTGYGGVQPAARGLVQAAEAGLMQAGAAVWRFSGCFESQFCYCVSRSGADYGIYGDFSGMGSLRLWSKGGLPLTGEEESRFCQLLNRPIAPVYREWGIPAEMESLNALYRVELIKSAESALSGMEVSVKSANPQIQRLMAETMEQLGCRLRDRGLTLQISASGRDVAVYNDIQDYIYTDKILCLVCLDLFRRGQDVAVPASAPRALDTAARAWGRKVFRYEDGFPSAMDHRARSLGQRQPLLRDGLMLGLRFLSLLRKSGLSLAEYESRLPQYAVISRTVPAAEGRVPQGMILTYPTGELRLRPVKGGKLAFLMAEAQSMEAAAELCRLGEEAALQIMDN